MKTIQIQRIVYNLPSQEDYTISSGTCIGAFFVLFFIQFYMEDDIL